MRPSKRFLKRYGVALATSVGAFLLTLFLDPLSERFPFALFIAAALISAIHGGMRPGLAATAISGVFLLLYQALLSAAQPPTPMPDFAPRFVLFLFVGFLSGYLIRACYHAVDAMGRLNDILGHVGDAVIMTDARGKITFLNAVAIQLTGWQREEAVEKNIDGIFQILAGDTHRPGENPVQRVLHTRNPANSEKGSVLVSRHKRERPVEYWANPVQDAEGNLEGVLLIFRDIGDRWLAEQDLHRREEQFRSLAGHAPVGLLVLDKSGRCIYSNACCQQLGGFNQQQGLGEGWLQFVHPEDRSQAIPWIEAAQSERAFAAEFRLRPPSQKPFWVQLRSAPLYTDRKEFLGHVGSVENIDSSKNLELQLEQYKQALENGQRTQQEREAQGQLQIAEMTRTHGQLHNQLAERHRLVEELRGKLDEHLQGVEKIHQDYRERETQADKRLAEKKKAASLLQHQLEESRQAQEELRRQLQDHQGAAEQWRQSYQLREQEWANRLEEMTAAQTTFKDQMLERKNLDEKVASEQLQKEEALRQRDYWKTVVNGLGTGVLAWDHEGNITAVNPAGQAYLGLGGEPGPSLPPLNLFAADGKTPLAEKETPFEQLAHGQVVQGTELVSVSADGEVRHLRAEGGPLPGNLGSAIVLHDITPYKRNEEKLRSQHADERRHDREVLEQCQQQQVERDQNHKRLSFLAEAGHGLGSSLDFQTTLQNIANLAVSHLADWCAIHGIEDNGSIRTLAVTRKGKTELTWSAAGASSPLPASEGLARIIRAGKPFLATEISDAFLADIAQDADQKLSLPENPISGMCVPLVLKGTTIGAISFVRGKPSERYGAKELALAEQFGRRATLALAHARAHQEACLRRDRHSQRSEFLQNILSHLGDGLYAVGREGELTYMNPAAERLLGWTETDLRGHDVHQLLTVPEANGLPVLPGRGAGHPELTTASVIRKEKILFRRKEGGLLPVSCTVAPVIEDERVAGAVMTFDDATERQRREEERDQKTFALTESLRRKDTFLERLVHELRPPLTQLRNTLMEKRWQTWENADEVKQNVTHLNAVLEGLWSVMQLGRGAFRLDLETIDLGALMERVVNAGRGFFKARQHELIVSDPLPSMQILADRFHLEQVFLVLLRNAAQYTEPGGRIQLLIEEDGHQATIRVRDNGMGIPSEKLAGLLEPHAFQGSNHRKEGLGIGLPLARRIVEMHHGSLEAFSEGHNHGSEFVVRLPVLADRAMPTTERPERRAEWEEADQPSYAASGSETSGIQEGDWLSFN